MKKTFLIGSLLATELAISAVSAADIVKTNNTTSLINGSSWVGGVAPTSTDTAVFDDTYAQNGGVNLATGGQLEWDGIRVGGSAVTYQIQLQNGNLNWVGVGAGGIDLSASSRNLLVGSLNVSADQIWTTKSGLTLYIGMNTTGNNSGRRFSGAGNVTLAGSGKVIIGGTDNPKLFTGNLTVQNGVTLQMTSGSAYGTTDGGVIIQSGGTLINSANNDARGETIQVEGVGDGAGAIQAINATAMNLFSDVRLTGDASFGGAARFDIGPPPGGTGTNVVLDLAGHTLTKIGNSQLQLKGGTVTDGSLDITSGILGFETGLTVAGSGTVHLRNGGTLLLFRASAGSPLNVSRSMVFDDGAYLHWTGQKTPQDIDVTVNSPIAMSGTPIISVEGAAGSAVELAGPISGAAAGFFKFGTNTLVLSGTNTYTGTAEVDAGTLLGVTGGSSAGSTVHVLDLPGAAFGVLVRDNSHPWSCSGLTLDGANSGLVFNFGYSVAPSLTTAPLQVNGDVAFGGAPVVTIQAGAIPAGTGSYPLLTWTGSLSGTAPTSAVLPPRVQGNLSVVGNTLFLNVTANGQPLNWVAGDGTWDIGTSPNWQDALGTGGQYYLETVLPGDNVVFGDLPGAGNFTVTLTNTVNPASVTVSNTVANYTIAGSGTIAGDGTLVKDGSGTLVLSNSANAFLGGTVVKAGTLLVPAKAGGGSYTVADGATLGVLVSSSSLNAAAINLGNCTISFIGISNNLNPVISNAGALTLAGVVTVNVTGNLLAGEYSLISSASLGGTGGFVLNSLPDGVVANIITNGNTVVLNVISSPASTPFVWTGLSNANWDSTTANNWTSNDIPIVYTNGHWVQFDDTAAQGNVTVAENVSPSSMLVSNNTLNYTFTSVGGAAIAGACALAKSGTGTLVLANTNTYTGGTIINSGALQLGDGLAQNGVVAGNVTNNASLIFANPADQVFTNVIRGTGSVTKNAAGTLVLSNTANAYQGGTTVAVGTLALGWTNSLGLPANPTNLATVLSGATLDINGQNLSDTYLPSAGYTITIAGTGTAGAGALTSSTTPPDNRGVPNLRLADDATIGSDADSKFWIRGGISGAHTLTKIGSNSVVITAGTIINSEVPALVVSNGTLSTSATLGATPVRVYGPGILALYTGSGIVFTNSLTLADGSTLLQTNGPNGWAAPIQMSGNITFEIGRGSLNVSGSLNGTGSLTKTGAQQLTLAGTNNAYAGNVSLTAGLLEAAADSSLGAGNVTVAAGATLQLDTPATMSSTASLTLADATALANLNYTGTQIVATLSFDGGATLAAAGTWGAVGSGAAHESASLSGTGLLQVSSITPPTPIPLAVQVSGGALTLTWPEPGWYAQSNSVSIANSNQWFDVPGSETGTNLVRAIDPAQPQVFYRLRHP